MTSCPRPLRSIESSDSLSVLLCYFWISHMLMPAKIGIDEMVTNCPKYDNWVCICESRFFGLFIGVPLWSFKIVFLTHNLWLPGTVCQVPYWMTRGLIIILWHEGSSDPVSVSRSHWPESNRNTNYKLPGTPVTERPDLSQRPRICSLSYSTAMEI